MKRLMPLLLTLLVIAMPITAGCKSKSVSTANTVLTAGNVEELDKLLPKYKFDVSKDSGEKYIYLFTIDTNSTKSERFEVSKGGSTDIIVPKNKKFIFSFPCDKASLYEWEIENELDESIIKPKEKSWVKIASINPFKSGDEEYRRNFSFESFRIGKQTIKFKYERTKGESTETFNCSFNISVQ